MPRKRTRHNSRKHSLLFTESPVNSSHSLCSPVQGAIHPITADTVDIGDEFDPCWVSPQFNPNSENSPPPRRQRRATRNRAACSRVSASSCQPLRNNSSHSKQAPRTFTSLKFVGEKDTTHDQTSSAAKGSSAENRRTSNRMSTRSKSTRTQKLYGGKPMNCSVNESLNPDEFDVTQQKRTRHSVDTRLHQTDDVNGQEVTDIADRADHRALLWRSCRLRQGVSTSQSSPYFKKQCASKRLLLGSEQRPYQPGRVLACDTPEADYGLKVSIRRRKELLPPAARSKLLC